MIKVKNKTMKLKGTLPELMSETAAVVAEVTEKIKEHDEDILKLFVDDLIDIAYLGKEKAAENAMKKAREAEKSLKEMLTDLFGEEGDRDGNIV